MPNHVLNKLYLNGNNDEIKNFAKLFNENSLSQYFHIMYRDINKKKEKDAIYYEFYTAYEYPENGLLQLSKIYKNTEITVKFIDENILPDQCGIVKINNGSVKKTMNNIKTNSLLKKEFPVYYENYLKDLEILNIEKNISNAIKKEFILSKRKNSRAELNASVVNRNQLIFYYNKKGLGVNEFFDLEKDFINKIMLFAKELLEEKFNIKSKKCKYALIFL